MTSVLIVEDDLIIADLLKDGLEADGYSVCGIARTVAEAMDSAAGHKPDFAVVDLRLANGDLGTDVAINLRKSTNAGIIFSTGNANDTGLLETLGEAVMTKPYRLRDVGRALKIMRDIAQSGQTNMAFPRNFRMFSPAVTEG